MQTLHQICLLPSSVRQHGITSGAGGMLPRMSQRCSNSSGSNSVLAPAPKRRAPPLTTTGTPVVLQPDIENDAARSSSAAGPGPSSMRLQQQQALQKPAPYQPAARAAKKPYTLLFSDEDEALAAYDSLSVNVSSQQQHADLPQPATSFNTLKVQLVLKRNMASLLGYQRPTPVQKHVLPLALSGHDVLAVSGTGSGKTAAYLIPAVDMLLGRIRTRTSNRAFPEAMVLLPTRELAEQVYNEARKLLKGAHIKACCLAGGEPIAIQKLALRGGVDLVVGTPGRLLQLVDESKSRLCLSRLRLLVVDEADMLLDLGFEREIMQLLANRDMPSSRQTMLVSASLPDQVKALTSKLLQPDYVRVTVGGMSTSHFTAEGKPTAPSSVSSRAGAAGASRNAHIGSRKDVGTLKSNAKVPVSTAAAAAVAKPWHAMALPPAELIHQRVLQASLKLADKMNALVTLLEPPAGNNLTLQRYKGERLDWDASSIGGRPPLVVQTPTIVFVNSLSRASAVQAHLAAAGASVALLHRDLTQDQRDEAMSCFKFGVTPLLVSTGLGSRGLDFPDVAHVINLDMPLQAEEYIHRIGRTGRAGRKGTATTLFTVADGRTAHWLVPLLVRCGHPPAPWLAAMEQQGHSTADWGKGAGRRATPDAVADMDSSQVPFGTYLASPRSGKVRGGKRGSTPYSRVGAKLGFPGAQHPSGGQGKHPAQAQAGPKESAAGTQQAEAEQWLDVWENAIRIEGAGGRRAHP